MGVRPMFEVPDGWVPRGFVFEVETTGLEQPAKVAQAFGARRYAYNWALRQVKANLDARTADPTVLPLAWNLYDLRKAWNQAKQGAVHHRRNAPGTRPPPSQPAGDRQAPIQGEHPAGWSGWSSTAGRASCL
jgi:putative transposase